MRDEAGRVLLINRSDNGLWALPAGALELGESIGQCAAREIYEETGLTPTGITPFAMYTGARYTSRNMYGHTYQLHVTAFRVDSWTGTLLRRTDETNDAAFFLPTQLPEPLAQSVPECLADLSSFEERGKMVLR